ncbi:MAG TPA: DUF454 domain-containing protein [Candidatus Atribacteria bacterium]|nr:DUF454 domain-containing protein [Candidatus Atribacteria bacterium]
MPMKPVARYLFIILGVIFLGLGVIGVFLPILPTTPFLLLTSFCFLRSSKRLYNWLINHRIFGLFIYNYLTYKAATRNTKIGTLIFLWVSLFISSLFISQISIKLLLLAVGIGVTIHIYSLKTLAQKRETQSIPQFETTRRNAG